MGGSVLDPTSEVWDLINLSRTEIPRHAATPELPPNQRPQFQGQIKQVKTTSRRARVRASALARANATSGAANIPSAREEPKTPAVLSVPNQLNSRRLTPIPSPRHRQPESSGPDTRHNSSESAPAIQLQPKSANLDPVGFRPSTGPPRTTNSARYLSERLPAKGGPKKSGWRSFACIC